MKTMKIRGPWEMIPKFLGSQSVMEIKEPGGKIVGKIVGHIYTGYRWEDQDNARLVACAPELFLLAAEVLVERGEESEGVTLERLRVKAQHLIDKIGGNDG